MAIDPKVLESAKATRERRGRETKLTDEMHAKVVELVRAGNYIETAAEAVGVDRSSFAHWMTWGRQGLEGGKANRYTAFFEAVTRARAEAEADLLETAKAGDEAGTSNGPAKCAQWVLERTRGAKYAQRIQLGIEQALEELLAAVEAVCGEKNCGCFEALTERLTRQGRGEDTPGLAGEAGPPIH